MQCTIIRADVYVYMLLFKIHMSEPVLEPETCKAIICLSFKSLLTYFKLKTDKLQEQQNQ